MTSWGSFLRLVGVAACVIILLSEDVSGHQCLPGWISRKGDPNCYYISPKSKRTTWAKASQFCSKGKGSLLKIDSPGLKTWIYGQVNRRIKADITNRFFWLGLSRVNKDSPWKWEDGSPLNTQLSLWRPGEPNNAGIIFKRENCGSFMYDSVKKLGMNDVICTSSYPFICQTQSEIPTYCDTETIKGWDTINNVCYKYMDYRRSWPDAKASCEGAGGQLVAPGDPAVQAIVQEKAKQNKRDVWINVISQPVTQTPNYQFVWANSTAVVKPFWASKQPKVTKGQENSTCVTVSSSITNTANWQTDSCDNEHQYVCSKVPGGCAPGWTPFSKWCYQFNFQNKLSWSKAKDYCTQQGAYLLEITTKDQQNNFLESTLGGYGKQANRVWIGLSDGNTGNFHWNSNAKMTFTNWAKQAPKDTPGKTDCGYMNIDDDDMKWGSTQNCIVPGAFLCQTSVNKEVYPVTTTTPPVSCDGGWKLNGMICYKFLTKHASWTGAKFGCTNLGGRLAVITSADTQAFIDKNIKQDTWTGLNDQLTNGRYTFSDVPLSTFKNWADKQPVQRPDWNCGIVNGRAGSRGKWSIVQCSKSYPYICEKTPNNVAPTAGVTTPPVTWSTNCGPFWDENPLSGYCYRIVNTPLSWKDARDFCQNTDNKGDLASITSLDEQNYISGRLTANTYLSYWIGGNDLNTEGGWEWTDGSGFAFMNWGSGQPDNWKKSQDCLRINMVSAKAWDDAQCTIRYPFVCKKAGKNARPPPTQSTHVEPVCGEGWLVSGSMCYEFNRKKANWGQARSACLHEGGDLLVISDPTTQAFVSKNIKVESWIGLNDRFKEKTFIWNGNKKATSLPFKNWAPKQPDNKKNQDCVTVQTKGNNRGKWRDNRCNGKWGYICQKPATCGKDWFLYGKNCYLFNTTGATWVSARNQCKRMNADLVTITTQSVQGFITGKLLRESWTGLNDQVKNKQYTWLDTSAKVPFFNWAKGQPDNRDSEDCGTIMKTSGKWRDRSCTQLYGFICQKSSDQLQLGCPDGWVGYEGHCYFSGYNPKVGSWQNARSTCMSLSGDLVSINNKEEQRFVFTRVAHAKTPAWIGLNDQDNFAGHRMFAWSDNSQVTFTNWAKGEPNNYKGTQNCVAINRDRHGGWDDYPCTTQDIRSYVCKKEMAPTAETTSNPMTKGCKTQGLGLFTTCYTFYQKKLSFGGAEKYCASKLKGHLATISSRYVQAFIASELADRVGNWWIGLSNSDPTVYKWNSGQTLTYTNWDLSHTGQETAGAVAISADKPIGLWKNQKSNGTKLQFICESPRTGTYTTPAPDKPTPNPAASCPNYFVGNERYCYRAFHTLSSRLRKTWAQARAFCQTYGGDLVSFHSKDEQDFVVQHALGRLPGIYWIGINDIQKEKGFEWSDGSPVDYTNWMPHQPDDHKHHEDCGEYNKNTNQWNDDNCNVYKDFICKVMRGATPNSNVEMPTLASPVPCSGHLSKWTYFNKYCYYVSFGYRTFYDARTYCQVYGGELVSVHSHDESDYVIAKISTQSSNSYFIGLNDIGENGYNWTDGSPLNFINWYQNQPDDRFGQQSCVQMIKDGFWQDINCGFKKRFICKAPNGTTPGTKAPATTIAPGNCPPGFFGLDSRCYIIKGDQKADQVNWTIAMNRCKQMGQGVTLATISNTLEQAFITSHLRPKKYNVWIGLHDQAISNSFIWVDNTAVKYTNWAKGEPNGYKPLFYRPSFLRPPTRDKEDCVEVYGTLPKVGHWNDKACNSLRGYVCQAPRSVSNPLPVTSPPPSYCNKPGYSFFGTSCYKVDLTKRTWADAAQSCRNDGGNLVSITSSYEQSYLITILRTNPKVAWIGFSQTQETGLYDWADNWPVTYTNWAYREPSRNGQTCVILIASNGQWRDVNCSYKMASVCKIHQGTPPPYTTRPPGYCADPTWTQNGDYCYYVSINSRVDRMYLSWPEAQYACSKKGMNLATIRNKADNDFVIGLLQQQKQRLQRGTSCWIGLQSKAEGGFEWQDKSVVDYVNWGKGEPSNNRTRVDEDCVILGVKTGQWYDKSCLYQQRYVCSTLKVIPTRVVLPNVTTAKTTPLPVIIEPSGNPKTAKPVTVAPVKTQAPVKTNKPVVTARPRTQPPQKVTKRPTKAPGRQTNKPVVTFAPTRRPFHPFSQKGTNQPITNRVHIPTRSPTYNRLHSSPSNGGGGISGGGIAGICIAVILTAALVTVGVLYFRRRQVSLRLQTTVGFDNALYNRTGDSVDIGGND